ncbi:MAG: OmpA family protein [Rhodocyclaceae bacterium]|nr:OmpA family protein [Rhodocyclaceae bacterium]MDZ4215827.1 OmpA family protein [Rhodocyclaceae bacterium]
MDALIVPAIALAAYLFSQPVASPDRIVLLPDADGTIGALVVTGATGEQKLDRAYAALAVDGQGKMQAVSEDAASVQQRYGGLLGAQPPHPTSFTVYFASGSSTSLTPESQPVLEQLKSALAQRPAPEISVIGHTDRVGKLEANDALSMQRAATVKEMLTAAGIRAVALEVVGRGEREPLVPTADEVAEPRNRRVEISVR